MAERQQECKEKLQEICDMLTQTENRLIGQQESLVIGDSKAELEQYQTRQEVCAILLYIAIFMYIKER